MSKDLVSFDRSCVPHQRLPRPSPAGARLERIVIGSLDDPSKGIEAQYNPKELSFDQSIPWTPHKVRGNLPDLQFTGGDGRTMSFELFFDGFEAGQSVQQAIADLVELSRVRNPDSNDDDLLRPHVIAVVWGSQGTEGAAPPFRGVIESISTKLTMFLPDGRPVRATCQVKVREVAKIVTR